jgi:hypothetical protein
MVGASSWLILWNAQFGHEKSWRGVLGDMDRELLEGDMPHGAILAMKHVIAQMDPCSAHITCFWSCGLANVRIYSLPNSKLELNWLNNIICIAYNHSLDNLTVYPSEYSWS